jgi:hypothetical protein
MRTSQRRRQLAAAALLVVLLAVSFAGQLLGQATDVVIVAGQRVYHASTCSHTASLNPAYLRTVKKDSLGAEFTACPVCKPDHSGQPVVAAPAAMERELEELWSRYDASELVAIILGPRATGLYHRKGCHWHNGGERQVFARKEADARFFQPHQECMRRPPDTFTAEAEDALRKGQPTPVRALVGGGVASTPPSAAVTSPATPAPARSTARQQCAATTKKGARCSRLAAVGSAYCWQHP